MDILGITQGGTGSINKVCWMARKKLVKISFEVFERISNEVNLSMSTRTGFLLELGMNIFQNSILNR